MTSIFAVLMMCTVCGAAQQVPLDVFHQAMQANSENFPLTINISCPQCARTEVLQPPPRFVPKPNPQYTTVNL